MTRRSSPRAGRLARSPPPRPPSRSFPACSPDFSGGSSVPSAAGRTVAATGVPGRPNEFYIGVNDGGVWKTTDYGRTWDPVFDDQSTGSIGAVAVAPSDPNTIYVGSGEGLQRPDLAVGDGIYKSTDAGRTWRHLGLRDGQQIPAIIVDPRRPQPAVRCRAGPSLRPQRRARDLPVHRWWRDLAEGALPGREHRGHGPGLRSSGSQQRVRGPLERAAVPWEIGSSWTLSGNNGLYKSSDGGSTWRQITAGLPGAAQGLGPDRHRGVAERTRPACTRSSGRTRMAEYTGRMITARAGGW